MQELHAQLLSFISKNFTFLINDPDIRYLRKEEFKLMLKHKYLNVTQEDEVLKAICLWAAGNNSQKSTEAVIKVNRTTF